MTRGELARGIAAFEARDWTTAFASLVRAAGSPGGLGPEDLERLATASRLTGHVDASNDAYERAHRAWLERGAADRAARTAFWLGMALMNEGETARAGGWFARGQSILDEHELDSVERGYLLLPLGLRALFSGDAASALDLLSELHRYAVRFADPDLLAISRLGRGQCLVALGRLEEGVPLLDEAMLSATTGTTTPVLAGIIYCAVIDVCLELCDLARAEEWTRALTDWCDGQPGLVPFRGQCLVDRAEILHIKGAWGDADVRVLEAHALFEDAGHPALGRSWYVRGELARVRGDEDAAEAAYRQAAANGHDPHPGLALLWLARGDVTKAAAAARRLLAEDHESRERARALAAIVEILLADDDIAAADMAVEHLRSMESGLDTPMLRAVVRTAEGATALASGDAAAADRTLRRGLSDWLTIGARLEAARTRVLIGRACHELGDLDTAELEWDTARIVFEELGAAPALASVTALLQAAPPAAAGRSTSGLTGRELEVIEQLATGKTNREIAAALVISEKTVSRHLSNIFTKLGVNSRAAATAYAFTHDLV